MIEDEQHRAQNEYTSSTERLRTLVKKANSLKGDAKKDIKAEIARLKDHRESLLTKVGIYTSEQKLFGFKEGNNDF
jgi:hypothetical protein